MAHSSEEAEILKEEQEARLEEALKSVKTVDEGVCVQVGGPQQKPATRRQWHGAAPLLSKPGRARYCRHY